MKICYKCDQSKMLEAFAIDNSRNSKDGRQNACRYCKGKIQRAYRAQRTPEQVRKAIDYNIALRKRLKIERPGYIEQQNRNHQLKTQYGINLEVYNSMFTEQKGLCLGCYRHASELNQSLAVDHDHKTKKIRGLLCNNCNRTLGYGKDNPAILRRLADYLEKYL